MPPTAHSLLASAKLDAELAEFVGQFYDDPLGFVQACYPWGDDGPLKDHDGPDVWQRDALARVGEAVCERKFTGTRAVAPIRVAVSSGHGIGKSTLQAWLVDWIMSTRPRARGTITANTSTQLDTKTWAAIQFWTKHCLTAHWFEINTTRMYRKGQRESWFCSPQSCKEENSEAFAGQHAADSTSFYVIDEGSAVADVIYEVSEGGLTDGEPMIFVFGNCTRSTGMFYRICFGNLRDRWHPIVVDSRTSKFTNKQQIDEWAQDYGEDSDFFRVRVKGLPPAASDLQYISSALVAAAQRRPALAFADDPLLCGLDVARGGSDDCTFRFRKGHDARSIAPIRVPGEQARDSMRLVTLATDVLSRDFDGQQVTMLFIDGTAIGGPICDRLKQLGHRNIVEVQFGAAAPDAKFANMRAWMWSRLREWLNHGALPEDPRVEQDLTGPGYHHDKQDRLVLESKEDMKKRGLDSPDDGDALALTFAADVRPTAAKQKPSYKPPVTGGWMR